MVRHPRISTNPRPPTNARRRKENSYVLQFVVLISAVGLLLGSVVVWKVYTDKSGWREWSVSMRSGFYGMHGKREGGEPAEDLGNQLADKSVRFLGKGYAELGEFSVGRYDAITNTTLTVSFKLKGMTPCEDETSFNTFMHENERAFRDRVTQAVRDCRPSDYIDTEVLGKKVVARVNRAFNGRFLESAELNEFDVFESIGSYEADVWEPEGKPDASE